MIDQKMIELSIDNLDRFVGEDRRKADYILDQLICQTREAEDVLHLTESLKRLANRNKIGA